MNHCPSKEEFIAFIQCKLLETEMESIEEHLESCITCREQLRKLELSENAVMFDFSTLFRRRDSLDSQVSRFAECMERLAEEDSMGDGSSNGRSNGNSNGNTSGNHSGSVLEIPESFGSYRILGKIGEGGMGEVYAAMHERLKRKVALKFIRRRRRLSTRSAEQFSREIEAAGRLSHPNIMTTYDANEYRGIPYLAMEFLEGESLQAYLERKKRLPILEVCRIITQVAQGLRCVHEAGLVHCDLKPSNLWRLPNGTIKVLDLGLARIRTSEHLPNGKADDSETVGGTPDFMAPEQCVPGQTVDEKADIYALGCTFFMLLTDELPFGSEEYSSIKKKMEAQQFQPLPRLAQFRDDISPATLTVFQQMIDRMTEKNPHQRYHSMGEVVSVLEMLMMGNQIMEKPIRKSRAWLWATIVTTMLWVMVFILIAYDVNNDVSDDKRKTQNNATTETEKTVEAENAKKQTAQSSQDRKNIDENDFPTSGEMNLEANSDSSDTSTVKEKIVSKMGDLAEQGTEKAIDYVTQHSKEKAVELGASITEKVKSGYQSVKNRFTSKNPDNNAEESEPET
ncbi:MAG: serine/threonine-protein kinase, partial [Planctomycetia bacterium]|nr:serine/threonine-protein kinase [Planctomycetia bacterium]